MLKSRPSKNSWDSMIDFRAFESLDNAHVQIIRANNILLIIERNQVNNLRLKLWIWKYNEGFGRVVSRDRYDHGNKSIGFKAQSIYEQRVWHLGVFLSF